MTSYYWRKIIPDLAERFTVVAPDLRGCGDSDRPTSGYDKCTVAEDIHHLVQHLKLGPINLISHDVGMMVAYAYASRYASEVRRLVLTEAALAGWVWRSCSTRPRTHACFTCRCLARRTGWRKH